MLFNSLLFLLAFLPGSLLPGIEIADPMVSIRNAAYPVSFRARQ